MSLGVKDIIQRRWPLVAGQLQQKTVVPSSTNDRLVFRGQSMTSSRPELEAGRLVSQTFGDDLPREVILLGHGAGHFCKILLDRGVQELRVIAPDADFLTTALEQWCDPKILEDSRLQLELPGRNSPEASAASILEVPSCVRIFARQIARFRVALEQMRSADLKLKILVVEPFSGGSLPVARYAASAFEQLGHKVKRMDYSGMEAAWRTLLDAGDRLRNGGDLLERFTGIAGELALHEAASFRPDLVFVLAQAPLPPAICDRMREMGMRTVFWFVEDYQSLSYWEALHGHYDMFLSIQQGEFHKRLKEINSLPVRYLPMCTAPEVHYPDSGAGLQEDLSFVGAGYHNRETMFLQLKRHGLKVWGSDWNRLHPAWDMVQDEGQRTTDAQNRQIFSGSRINLNLHSSSYHQGVDPAGDFVNPRTFDILACGGFQLCDSRSLLPELLEPGKHLKLYRDVVELNEGIAYYLAHPAEAAQIAAAGREHVLREHTYLRRMSEFLEMTLLIHPDWFPAAEKRKTASLAGNDPELRAFLEQLPKEVEHNVDAIAEWLESQDRQLAEVEELFLFMARIRDWARSKKIDQMLEAQLGG